jgi:hypothetical protein
MGRMKLIMVYTRVYLEKWRFPLVNIQKNYGKSQCLMVNSTMFMACSIAILNCQRVITWDNDNIWQLYKDNFVGYNPTVILSLVYIYS